MLAPFVFGAADPADPQYGQLAHPCRQRRLGHHVSAEHHPPSRQVGVVGHGSENSEDITVGASHPVEQLELGLVGLFIGDGWHTWKFESHIRR